MPPPTRPTRQWVRAPLPCFDLTQRNVRGPRRFRRHLDGRPFRPKAMPVARKRKNEARTSQGRYGGYVPVAKNRAALVCGTPLPRAS